MIAPSVDESCASISQWRMQAIHMKRPISPSQMIIKNELDLFLMSVRAQKMSAKCVCMIIRMCIRPNHEHSVRNNNN